MASTIVSRTVGVTPDQRISLNSSTGARIIAIGTSWTRLRLGFRFSVTDSGASLAGVDNALYVGVMAGPNAGATNGPNSGVCPHFFGATTNSLSTFTRNVGPPIRYSAAMVGSRIIAGVETLTAQLAPTKSVSAQPADNVTILIVDILKGSPNFTITVTSSLTPLTNTTQAQLLESMAFSGAMTASSTTTKAAGWLNRTLGVGNYTSSNSTTLAINEAVDGFFDSVVLSWNKATINWEFSDVVVAKVT